MMDIGLLFVAAILNAVMDILENENFLSSRLAPLDQKWWYKRVSWQHAKKVGGWKFDGWHVAKSFMLFCMIGAIADSLIEFVILGVLWNVAFNVTYKFLKK